MCSHCVPFPDAGAPVIIILRGLAERDVDEWEVDDVVILATLPCLPTKPTKGMFDSTYGALCLGEVGAEADTTLGWAWKKAVAEATRRNRDKKRSIVTGTSRQGEWDKERRGKEKGTIVWSLVLNSNTILLQ